MQTMQKEPELLTITEIENKYGLSGATILTERSLMRKVKQKKIKPTEDGEVLIPGRTSPVNTTGFGYTTPAVMNGRRVMYRKIDVEKWIENQLEDLTPEERVNKTA